MAFNVFKKKFFSWLDILDNNSIVKEWKFTLKFWKRKKNNEKYHKKWDSYGEWFETFRNGRNWVEFNKRKIIVRISVINLLSGFNYFLSWLNKFFSQTQTRINCVTRLFIMFNIETSYWFEGSDSFRQQETLLRIAYDLSSF